MASYNELNALIDAYINRNGVQAITGQILNGVLKAMVEQLGRGYTIMGAAIPTTDPGTPDGPECYFASETGTYTDFGGLQVVPGELALLCYTPSDGWTKATIYEGFREVGATIDGNVGTPSVGVSYANGVLSFDFHNMKGNPGQNGQDGAAAGFGTIGADITGGVGTPGVTVESSGPATAKNLQFHFTNLKGETGVTSVVATVDNTTGTPACTVSLVGQQLTLAFTGLKGAQGDTGSSVDYPFTIVNNLTTDDATQALSAAQGVVLEGEITQLEAKVDDLDGQINGAVPKYTYNGVGSGGQTVMLSDIGKAQGDRIDFEYDGVFENLRIYNRNDNYLINLVTITDDGNGHGHFTVGTGSNINSIYIQSNTSSFPVGTTIVIFGATIPGITERISQINEDIETIDGEIADIVEDIGGIESGLFSINYTEQGENLFVNGHYIKMDGTEAANNSYSCTGYLSIPVKKDIGLIRCQTGNQYMACIAFYKRDKTFISALQSLTPQQSAPYTVLASQIPDETYYIRVNGVLVSANDKPKIEYQVSVSEMTSAHSTDIDALYSADKLLDERVTALENEEQGTMPIQFEALAGNATTQPTQALTLLSNKIRFNSLLTAEIDGTIESVNIGVGYTQSSPHRTYEATWCELTPTQVKRYGYFNAGNVLMETFEHGLVLTGKTVVNIITGITENETNNPPTMLQISTDRGDVWSHEIGWGQGAAFFENNNSAGNVVVSLRFMVRDITKNVWCFGDSYFTYWPKYLYPLGVNKWLRNSQPGLGPDQAYTELQNLLSLGYRPSYVLWTLGMNGATTEAKEGGNYVINPSQKTTIDNVKALCESYGIIPVFMAIPTVPTRQKTGFRNYILGLGVRYVDVYKAVGADEYGIWHGKPTLRGWTNGNNSVYTQIYGDSHGIIVVGDNVFDVNGDILQDSVQSVGQDNSDITVGGVVYTRDSAKDVSGLLSSDGIHPSELGGKVIANCVLAEFPEISISE